MNRGDVTKHLIHRMAGAIASRRETVESLIVSGMPSRLVRAIERRSIAHPSDCSRRPLENLESASHHFHLRDSSGIFVNIHRRT